MKPKTTTQLHESDWVCDMQPAGEIECVIPLFLQDEGHVDVIGASIITSEKTKFVYFTKSGWESVSTYTHKHDPVILNRDNEYPVAYFVKSDANIIQQLIGRMAELIRSEWGVVFQQYTDNEKVVERNALRDVCKCPDVYDSSVRKTRLQSSATRSYVYRCRNCGMVLGSEVNDFRVGIQELFNMNWVSQNPGDYTEVETDRNTLRMLDVETVTENSVTGKASAEEGDKKVPRLHRVVDVLREIKEFRDGMNVINSETELRVIVLVKKRVVVGYLLWGTVNETQVIVEDFIRDEFNRQELTRQLVELWCENLCTSDVFYASEPTSELQIVLQRQTQTGLNGTKGVECCTVKSIGDTYDRAKIVEGP